MKFKALFAIILGIIILAACGGVTPVPTSINSTVTAVPSNTVTAIIYPTVTMTPSPFPSLPPEVIETARAKSFPTLPVHPDYPTEQAPTFQAWLTLGQSDPYIKNWYIDKYVIRQWNGLRDGYPNPPYIITISTLNQPQIEVWADSIHIHYLSGSDVTGDGTPDLILETSGGQWNGTEIYELGDTPNQVLAIYGQFRVDPYGLGMAPSAEFSDIDNSGSMEYIIRNYFWDGKMDFCALHRNLVYEYIPGQGYEYAVPKFREYLNYELPTQTTLSQDFKDEYDRYYAFCQLATEYAMLGDFANAKLVLTSNLDVSETEKAWELITNGLSRIYAPTP